MCTKGGVQPRRHTIKYSDCKIEVNTTMCCAKRRVEISTSPKKFHEMIIAFLIKNKQKI